MPRAKFKTLTEQMFYVLLCLKKECYGLDILDRVPQMTEGRVNVGSGTLYNLLEQFLESEMIVETKVEGRRRSYILTDKGKDMLKKELAEKADISTFTISKMSKGESVTTDTLVKICKALDCTLDDIMELVDE